MKRLGPLFCIVSFFLFGCTGTFQSIRRYSGRQYVRISDLTPTNEPFELVEKHNPSFEKVKKEPVPIRTSVQWRSSKTIHAKTVPGRTVFIRSKKITQLNPNSSLSRFEPQGKPTLNILAFILTMTYFFILAGFILGILGVALNRPLRGLGIASICIYAAGMIAFLLVLFLVIL